MGLNLVGVTKSWKVGLIEFEEGLAENIAQGDQAYFDVLRDADGYIERNGLPFPEEPEAWELLTDPDCIKGQSSV